MDFQTYKTLAAISAKVPHREHLYYLSGLLSEAEEFAKNPNALEVGDLCWYWTILTNYCFNLDLSLFELKVTKQDYSTVGLNYFLTKAIQLTDAQNKLRRAEYHASIGDEKDKREAKFALLLGSTIKPILEQFGAVLAMVCNENFTSVEEVLKLNIRKLYDRFGLPIPKEAL